MAAVFPIVFLGELPDKTMFASLVLSAKGRPGAVWIGAAVAFGLHVVIAVSVGVALFDLLPRRGLEIVVSAIFIASAFYSYRIRNETEETASSGPMRSSLRTAIGAGGVIFLAEWGDLTQILTANLAARYHSAISVAVGSLAALWLVAAIAVVAGTGLLRVLSVRSLRLATAVVLSVLGLYNLIEAVTT